MKRKSNYDAGKKIIKSTKSIESGYFSAAGLQADIGYKMTAKKGMTCKICVEHYGDKILKNCRARVKNVFSSQFPNIVKSVQYLTMRCLMYILMQ